MEQKGFGKWIAIGMTAFVVIGAAILWFFFLNRFDEVAGLLGRIAMILRPIQYGMVLAFLLLPVHRRLMRLQKMLLPSKYLAYDWVKGAMNGVAVLLSLSMAALLFYLLMAMLLPQLYVSVVGVVKEVPQYIIEIQSWLSTFFKDNPDIQMVAVQYYGTVAESFYDWLQMDLLPNFESVASTIGWLKDAIVPNVSGVVSNVYGVLIGTLIVAKDLFVGIVVAVYLLIRKNTFAAQSKKIVYSAFSTKVADFIVEEVRGAYRILSGFINGKLLDSLIIGIISFVCCTWMDFPYPVLLATVIGVTNVIPFFGPFIGGIPCGILILLVSPMQCLYFIIFILVLQQFDGNILGPKILGESTGLASFWVLFSILLFGGLFGFTGMVLGVPVFAMIYSLINKLVRYGLKQRGLPLETAEYMGKTPALAVKTEETEVEV